MSKWAKFTIIASIIPAFILMLWSAFWIWTFGKSEFSTLHGSGFVSGLKLLLPFAGMYGTICGLLFAGSQYLKKGIGVRRNRILGICGLVISGIMFLFGITYVWLGVRMLSTG